MTKFQISNRAKTIRLFRKIHRSSGLILLVFILNVAITGILLGWKKNSADLILPKTQKGSTSDLSLWLPLDSLAKVAGIALHQTVSAELSLKIARIDARKQEGIVKFVYFDHYWGVQMDAATADVLQIRKRRSDFLEQLHDASYLDRYFGFENDYFKLFFTSLMGLALLLFSITGFWMWYGPKQIRKAKSIQKK
ncbi:MAG: PepSY domain-containing protein [Bacteroidetes bacterium]|nr:PepSY domain-containing protein [Bacteroidota bacterium]